MTTRNLETRELKRPIEYRAADGDGGYGTLVGYGAVLYNPNDPATQFEVYDDLVERFLPGCFDKTLEEDDRVSLFCHTRDKILGNSLAGTLRSSVDTVGFRFEVDLPDTPTGKEVHTLVERGDLRGASVGMIVTGYYWERENGIDVRNITEVRIYECGPVIMPAYPGTSVSMRDKLDGLEEFRAEQDRERNEVRQRMGDIERRRAHNRVASIGAKLGL